MHIEIPVRGGVTVIVETTTFAGRKILTIAKVLRDGRRFDFHAPLESVGQIADALDQIAVQVETEQ